MNNEITLFMNKNLILYPVHCLISMYQITNLYGIHIKEMIGFSNVQELV